MINIANKQVAALLFLITALLLGETVGLPYFSLDKAQEVTAYILIIAAVLWISEAVPLFVVSFLILALEIVWLLPNLNLKEIELSATIFYSAFFSNIILLFLGGFVLSVLMQKYGLDIRFSQFILTRTKGQPKATLLGIIGICAFLSMWISNTATTAMMLATALPLIKQIAENHKFRTALVLSIPFACNIGGLGTPIGTPPNAIALSYLYEKGISLDFMQWMSLTLPFLIFFLFVLWQLLLWIYPPEGVVLKLGEHQHERLSAKHWGAIVIFLVTALAWLFAKNLGLKTGTIALFPIIASFWFRLLDQADFRKIPWDILYIISGGLALGVALNISGLGDTMVRHSITDTHPLILLAMATFVVGAMSTVMSNTATAGLVIPLLMSLSMEKALLITLVLATALMCSMAMALPVTTPPNAIAFSAREIKTRDMMLTGGIITILGFATVIIFGPWYWGTIVDLLNITTY